MKRDENTSTHRCPHWTDQLTDREGKRKKEKARNRKINIDLTYINLKELYYVLHKTNKNIKEPFIRVN